MLAKLYFFIAVTLSSSSHAKYLRLYVDQLVLRPALELPVSLTHCISIESAQPSRENGVERHYQEHDKAMPMLALNSTLCNY